MKGESETQMESNLFVQSHNLFYRNEFFIYFACNQKLYLL